MRCRTEVKVATRERAQNTREDKRDSQLDRGYNKSQWDRGYNRGIIRERDRQQDSTGGRKQL